MKYDGIENPTIPQWLDKIPIKERGLDLLGSRNPVLSIGNVFLSGVTTITPAIRNLSYRSWIIWIYAQWELPADERYWRSFRERIESAFALSNLAVDPKMFGVIGSRKANTVLNSETNEIELVNLVKSQKAFATYSNISQQLGLSIEDSNLLPALTSERGIKLAKEFDSKIKQTEFYSKIKSKPEIRYLTREELKNLGKKIRLDSIPSEEADILISSICPNNPLDGKINEYYRISTYTILLELAKKHKQIPTESNFFQYAISQKKHPIQLIEFVRTGWLMYLMRDVISVTHEVLFEYIVDVVASKPSGIDEDDVVKEIVENEDDIIRVLKELHIIRSKTEYKNLTFNKLISKIRKIITSVEYSNKILRWKGDLNEETIIEKAWEYNGSVILVLIAWILVFIRLEKYINDGISTKLISLFRDRSKQLSFMETILPLLDKYKNNNFTISEMLDEIIRLTINQHLKISWIRFANDPSSVAVIYRDENILKYRREFAAGRIQSRLTQGIGWLEQLKLIDSSGITEKGKKQIKINHDILKEYHEF